MFFEARCNVLCAARKNAYIAARSREVEAEAEEKFNIVHIARKRAGRFAGSANALRCVFNSRLYIRMLGVAEMAKVCGQVARSDKDTVDALHRGDGFDLLECSLRL